MKKHNLELNHAKILNYAYLGNGNQYRKKKQTVVNSNYSCTSGGEKKMEDQFFLSIVPLKWLETLPVVP